MILFARYGVLLRPENLTGTDLTVDVLTDPLGATEPRTARHGDIVMEVLLTDTGTRAALWIVHEDRHWSLAPNQPVAGDLVVATCPASDLLYQAGAVSVFCEDGTFVPVNFGLTLALTGH